MGMMAVGEFKGFFFHRGRVGLKEDTYCDSDNPIASRYWQVMASHKVK